MKKILFTIALAAFAMSSMDAMAQDQVAPAQTETRSAENIQKEADALKSRIIQYVAKVEANKDNDKLDYPAEQARIVEMKAKWEALTGETWKDEKK